MERVLYFKDNFFSSGRTEIFNDSKYKVGELDLKGALSSNIDVLNKNGKVVVSGKITFLSNKWRIYNEYGKEIGILKGKLNLFSKKYEYDAYKRGIYYIKSEALSRQYDILDEQANLIGKFEKVSGFFASPAFKLTAFHETMTTEELIAVVMGVNAIRKRQQSSAAN